MKIRLWLMISVSFLAGCTSTLAPTVKQIDTLQSGKLQVRKTGEPMIERGILRVQPGFKAKVDSFLPKAGDVLLPLVKKGETFECAGITSDEFLICSLPERVLQNMILADGSRLGGIHKFVFNSRGVLMGVLTPTGNIVQIDEKGRAMGVFEPVQIPLLGSQKTELIYDGRIDDIIKITYLEFGTDFTRPIYFKGLSYNISSLNLINVKDMMIEVVDANEKEIKFLVRN